MLSVKLNRSFAGLCLGWINNRPSLQHHLLLGSLTDWIGMATDQTRLQRTFVCPAFFPRLLWFLSSLNGKCGCAIWNNFTVRLYKNLSCRKWSVLLFLFQLVASKVLHRFMLVVLHTVLLASETKQHCGLCLRYSTGTCCRAEKAGEYSKGKTACAFAFVLKVNQICNQPNFLMILSQHLVLFALL